MYSTGEVAAHAGAEARDAETRLMRLAKDGWIDHPSPDSWRVPEFGDDVVGIYRSYADGVRIVEVAPEHPEDRGPRYRFEAPRHVGRTLEDADLAELYAAVYFAVDGFREEDTGGRGVPLAVARADDAVLAAYTLAAQSGTSPTWLRRTFEVDSEQVQVWLDDVRKRAAAHPAVDVFESG